MSGWTTRFRRQPGQRVTQDRQFDAAQPRFDGHRPAAGDLHAAAEQGGDVHGAAVDVEQLAFEAMLGEDAAVLGDPEKRLGGVDRRVGNAQLVGSVGCWSKEGEYCQQCEVKSTICHDRLDTALPAHRSRDEVPSKSCEQD